MGTNFYWLGEADRYSGHIGKRSAAGWYCYDCRVSLCLGGESMVHDGRHGFYERCPQCGKGMEPQAYRSNMVELGFEQPATQKMTGVQTASSFIWAQQPEQVIARCNEHLFEHCIEDEYGQTYTGQQFLWMLDVGCPIRFYHSIGIEFS